jgi:hypothetical protein
MKDVTVYGTCGLDVSGRILAERPFFYKAATTEEYLDLR